MQSIHAGVRERERERERERALDTAAAAAAGMPAYYARGVRDVDVDEDD